MRIIVSIFILVISYIVVNAFVNEVGCRAYSFISSHGQEISYQGHLVLVMNGEAVFHCEIGSHDCCTEKEETEVIRRMAGQQSFGVLLINDQTFRRETSKIQTNKTSPISTLMKPY